MSQGLRITAAVLLGLACGAATAGPMIRVPGGSGPIGSDRGPVEERPMHTVEVAVFALDRSPVTVSEFAAFAAATGHRTTAESLGGSVMQFGTGRWTLVDGADWRSPQGPGQRPAPPDHPVTQVSWHDARAYCAWAGKRLPTEYEWEHAARSGHAGAPVYAFGDHLLREGDYLANVWTGVFPVLNTAADGHALTAPVGRFGVSPLGLTDMAGNVWEWVDADFRPYPHDAPTDFVAREKVQRGGSYLCDPKVCHGYRVSARGHATPDSALMHVGFRCARSLDGS